MQGIGHSGNVPFSLFPNFLAKHSYGFANTLSKKDRLRAVFLVSPEKQGAIFSKREICATMKNTLEKIALRGDLSKVQWYEVK